MAGAKNLAPWYLVPVHEFEYLFIFMYLEKLKIYYLTILIGKRERNIILSGFRFFSISFSRIFSFNLTHRINCRELINGVSICSP
jgi:hypothetical protein